MTELKSESGLELMNRFLAPCPERRISAEAALKHPFFEEEPRPAPPNSFPTWPSKNENRSDIPLNPPSGLSAPRAPPASMDADRARLLEDFNINAHSVGNTDFSLK